MITDARETVADAGYGLVDRIRENPVPAAIAGLGLAWLLFGGGSGRPRRSYRERELPRHRYARGYYGRYAPARSDLYDYEAAYAQGPYYGAEYDAGYEGESDGPVAAARERVGEAADQVRAQAEGLAEGAREQVEELSEEARWQMVRARYRAESMMGQSPLALGAIALGVGAAVGLAGPSTERENEWLGEARDELMEQARGVVSEVGAEAERTVGEKLSESGAGQAQTSSGGSKA